MPWTFSEYPMYGQFTSCVQRGKDKTYEMSIMKICLNLLLEMFYIRDHPFSAYAKFPKKPKFLTP